jgi:hypothetical protein
VSHAAHASDLELQRLADDGDDAVDVDVLVHVRQCAACASAVRYARAVREALPGSLSDEAAPEELLRRVVLDVTAAGGVDEATRAASRTDGQH